MLHVLHLDSAQEEFFLFFEGGVGWGGGGSFLAVNMFVLRKVQPKCSKL